MPFNRMTKIFADEQLVDQLLGLQALSWVRPGYLFAFGLMVHMTPLKCPRLPGSPHRQK